MTSKLRELAGKRTIWLLTACFLGLIGLADYHYSRVNQIPSDGPLTIGFPVTFYRMVCPMIVSGAGACQKELRALGFAADLAGCIAFATLAAFLSMHLACKRFVRRTLFWMVTGAVFSLAFLLSSLATALHSASHRGRAIEIGFPTAYLYEYAGDSFNAINLVTDLSVCFVAAFFCVAAFFRR